MNDETKSTAIYLFAIGIFSIVFNATRMNRIHYFLLFLSLLLIAFLASSFIRAISRGRGEIHHVDTSIIYSFDKCKVFIDVDKVRSIKFKGLLFRRVIVHGDIIITNEKSTQLVKKITIYTSKKFDIKMLYHKILDHVNKQASGSVT